MQRQPDTLDVPRGNPMAAIKAFLTQAASHLWMSFFAAFQFFRHASDGPNWINCLLLLACISLALSVLGQVRGFMATFKSDTPYVKMDKSGLACSLPMRQRRPWSDIAACACKNDNGRTVLRLFLRGLAKPTVDIDFALAAQPKRSLDAAMVACAAWIVATRDPSETENPIREFVDKQRARGAASTASSSRTALYPFLVFCAVAVVAVGALVAMGRPVREEPPMRVDGRPEQKVLFLGNSRIAYNDLPKMVRDVADSANSPIRYDIHMRAWGGATLREHWNDGGDQALLQRPWHLVILQPQSAAFMDGSVRDTDYYGARLAYAAEAGGSQVALIANWGLGPGFFSGDSQAAAVAATSYAAKMGRETRTLAQLSSAGVIDLEGAFADAEASVPEIAMTNDGNHPTHAGTFLAALVIYGYLSHADLSGIDWRPYDMSRATAATLKAIAARHRR